MNNTAIRSLYGLKYNPFLPDVPPDALYTIPGTEHFALRVEASVWNKIRLVFEGIKALIGALSGGMGQISAELANKLKAVGLLGFVVTMFKVYYRVREALAGLWGAFSHAFAVCCRACCPG